MRSKSNLNPMFMNMGKILHSRAILYIVLVICLFQLFLFTSLGDYYSAAVFILVGYLTTFFSKNMMVILTIALVVSTIMKYGTQVRLGGREGFGPGEDTDTDTTNESDDKPKTTTTPKIVTPTINVDAAEGDEKAKKIIAEKQTKLNNITKEYATLSEQMSTLENQANDINKSLTSVEQLMSRITQMINSETKT